MDTKLIAHYPYTAEQVLGDSSLLAKVRAGEIEVEVEGLEEELNVFDRN